MDLQQPDLCARIKFLALVAQLDRALACGARCRGFKSLRARHLFFLTFLKPLRKPSMNILGVLERWQSGRMQLTANELACLKRAPGFKSQPLRILKP